MTGRVQARLHAVPAPAILPDLKDWIARRITASAAVPDPVADRALVALAELPDGDQLCHGDLHPGNILLTRAGPSVIDWPNATRGDPTADLARTLVLLRSSTLPPETPLTLRLGHRAIRRVILRALIQGYQRIRPVDQTLLDRWLFIRTADRLADGVPAVERAWLLNALTAAD
jgi:aminoglycoside phosphotransferase (APT) family kinase protein